MSADNAEFVRRFFEALNSEVAMLITARGRRTAIPVEQRTVGVWTLRDGKALRARVYPSAAEALASVGLSA